MCDAAKDQRIADLEKVLEAILDGVGAFTPDGWLANTEEIVAARKVLLDGKP